MVTRAIVLVTFALAIAACTAGTSPATTNVGPTSTEPVVSGPGRLALVDEAGNIVVIDPDGSNRIEMATAGEDGRAYGQPIWSPDGSVVSWAQASPTGFAYVVQEPGSETATEIDISQYPFYAYWSPAGERVGLLRNGDGGVVFEIADVPAAVGSVVDTDTPYYFSWNPAGDGLVAHAGATSLVNRDHDGLELSAAQTGSGYLAPQWLAQGILHVDGNELVLDADDGERALIAEVSGLTTFVANPQGTMVAVQALAPDDAISVALGVAPTVALNALVVVDVESGDATTLTDTPVIAFFWSPDGQSLLIMSLSDARDGILPSVWDGGSLTGFMTYAPSPVQVRDLFPFFPQYAQSLSFWSADSASFVLVGAIGGESGVWVQDLGEEEPRFITGGSWAAWSP